MRVCGRARPSQVTRGRTRLRRVSAESLVVRQSRAAGDAAASRGAAAGGERGYDESPVGGGSEPPWLAALDHGLTSGGRLMTVQPASWGRQWALSAP